MEARHQLENDLNNLSPIAIQDLSIYFESHTSTLMGENASVQIKHSAKGEIVINQVLRDDALFLIHHSCE